MGWSSGTFTRVGGSTAWADDRDAGTEIEAGLHDTHDEDLADGINACLLKDGTNAATANLNIGTNRLTSVGDPTADQDAATKIYVDTLRVAAYATPTPTAIGATETSEGSATIVIPATWNTYDLEALATGYVYESGTIAGTPFITWRFREGAGVAGTQFGTTTLRMDGNAPTNYIPFGIFGYETGETTTGSRVITLSAATSSDGAQMSHAGVVIKVAAFRLT